MYNSIFYFLTQQPNMNLYTYQPGMYDKGLLFKMSEGGMCASDNVMF